ncbi:hypothetical protein [Amycolatopsis sp. NPDC051371]|uniref:hypothetical protein n=1 Tax=Amycolatopsis sp. NPDC051371 TaxID=3155800 RepID=UPI0034172585
MSEEEIAEFAGFWKAVQEHTSDLSEPQKALLNMSVKFAWVATATDEQLEKGFVESFTPEQAALVRDYQSPDENVQLLPRLYRGFIKLT